ncbi:hypothetical protein WJX81_004486 [Elliptochloris bilobata]|uniref:Uncharacterized protein n=1 Tax=Elliptochloris bilobata TaxID=381761 RepID=A0AAW1RMW8_9CHLO
MHQSWKDVHVPLEYARWTLSWKSLHPNWEYRLWTDADNEALVNDHYPWFKDTYDSLPKPVMKADACRVLYMHKYGGMYADLDFEALRNVEPLLPGQQVLLGSMMTGMDACRAAEWAMCDHAIPNAWMASVRGHPFWLFALQQIIKAAGEHNTSRWDFVETVTGPVMLYNAVKAYRRVNSTGLNVLEPGVIYPINWLDTMWVHEESAEDNAMTVCDPANRHFSDTECKKRFPDAYAITYWSHSWAPRGRKGR